MAGDYDRIESFMALGSGSWYRRRALSRAGLKPGMKALDIVDPSPGMLERTRVSERVGLVVGSAEAIYAAAVVSGE
jgi:demethylmenaquinone methyltransferase / 2-methoxy-6-polyprenyl-1,4-benzoquinol methylase